MIKYIHGSEDSTDVDVFYVFDELPSKEECKKFCSEDPEENRNIIVVKGGVVVSCYKGTPDETNNALFSTYGLHQQSYPLIIERKVDRDVTIKVVRAVRIILSHLSRSQYRGLVKKVLKGTFTERLEALSTIDLGTIDCSTLNKNMSREDVLKVIAFQIGQTLDLLHGKESYTKSEISAHYPALKSFLKRELFSDENVLNEEKNKFLAAIKNSVRFNGYTVTDGVTTYDVRTEEKV